MHVRITYPPLKKKYSFERHKMLSILRWPLIGLGLAACIVNLCVGGPWWCILALIALYIAWRLFLSPDLVEYNRISQSIKGVFWACVMLLMVDWLIVPIHAVFVLPLAGAGGLVLCATLFFTDLETQKHNMLPLLLFIFCALVASVVGIGLKWAQWEACWPYMTLFGTSMLFLLSLIIILRRDLWIEMRRRFHIK